MEKMGRLTARPMISRRGGLMAAAILCAAPRLSHAFAVQDQVGGDPIYTGKAVVTGTDNRDRPRGLGLCLGEVLIKASGDPNILAAPGFAALRAQAASMVLAISYHDRMSALPKHDEQGTRDRPFTLTALFDKAKIAAALKRLGSAVWTGRRPTVFLTTYVHAYSGRFILTAGTTIGYDQPPLMRAAIQDASARAALPVELPPHEGAPAPQDTLPLTGHLDWSDAANGWIAQWSIFWNARQVTWGERGVSFDQAYDAALLGALGVVSGHHPPRGASP